MKLVAGYKFPLATCLPTESVVDFFTLIEAGRALRVIAPTAFSPDFLSKTSKEPLCHLNFVERLTCLPVNP